jgi:hypothetical protein
MCDYSLYTVNNRLACESDDLVLHRFDTGSIGFCAAAELHYEMSRGGLARGWTSFIRWLFPRKKCGLTAVCIPPGARLLVSEVPPCWRPMLGVSLLQMVEFTQLSEMSYAYRDALRFADGKTVLLQKLPEGLRATVMALAPEEETPEVPIYVASNAAVANRLT